ncbi:hypothetical protein M513_07539 [Trichuris suis]|uniref:Uncharacterized protein n=1 Tax=Trichuris suis TaxID=68888 RepID=A0A085M364_9BILA|nr:hypothetical protein M513_07539 [Trichuris suis]
MFRSAYWRHAERSELCLLSLLNGCVKFHHLLPMLPKYNSWYAHGAKVVQLLVSYGGQILTKTLTGKLRIAYASMPGSGAVKESSDLSAHDHEELIFSLRDVPIIGNQTVGKLVSRELLRLRQQSRGSKNKEYQLARLTLASVRQHCYVACTGTKGECRLKLLKYSHLYLASCAAEANED